MRKRWRGAGSRLQFRRISMKTGLEYIYCIIRTVEGGVNRWCTLATRKTHPRMSPRGSVFREPRGYLPGPLPAKRWSRRTTMMNCEFVRSFVSSLEADLGIGRRLRGSSRSLEGMFPGRYLSTKGLADQLRSRWNFGANSSRPSYLRT